MLKHILLISLTGILISCGGSNNRHNSAANHDGPETLTMEQIAADTTKVLVAGFPVCLDSTAVLIHPIGWESNLEKSAGNYKSESSGMLSKSRGDYNVGLNVSSNGIDYLSGNMINLLFEDMQTGRSHMLTDKLLLIKHVTYLKEVACITGNQYLFYTLYDKDNNRDGKLDYKDLRAYYISNLNGTGFTKITPDGHFIRGDKMMFEHLRFYFQTIEDTDGNDEFNNNDKYHYYYVDFSVTPFKVIEYNPLGLLH